MAEKATASGKALEEYIRKAVDKGKNARGIEESLLKAGWPKKVVAEALKAKAESLLDKKQERLTGTVMRLENVKKAFGEHLVLNGVNLDIKAGELFGIIGLSGSGKTTLLNTMIGFFEPEEGRILFRQKAEEELDSIFKKIREARKSIGFASQEASFYPKLTVEENLDLYATLHSIPRKQKLAKINELLNLMELQDSRKTLAQNLSGGMQKRLSVACSLIHNPRLLLLDEPTADLDPFLRKEMWSLIKRINESGTTVVLASHFLTEMEGICSKIGILHNGRIIESGTPDELKDMYSKNEEIHLETVSGNYDRIIKGLEREKLPMSRVVKEGHKIVIYTPKADEALYKLVNVLRKSNERIMDIDLNKPSLSEVFESFIKK